MKKVITILTIMLAFCAGSQNASAQVSTVQGNAQATSVKKIIRPLPPRIDIKNLKNATVVVSFSAKDFDWIEGKLTLTIYEKDLYAAADIAKLKDGDMILYDGDTLTIEKFDRKKMEIINDCVRLAKEKDGTYSTWGLDDYVACSEVGTVKLPLSENFIFIDDTQFKAKKIKKTNLKQYMENRKKNGSDDFSSLDTKATIKNGIITNITNFYIP